jgi:hypothetical protein
MALETITAAERLELLIRAGKALYGAKWQNPLARGLGIDLRSIQRWVAGDRYLSLGVLRQLVEHCRERSAEIEKARDEIAQRLPLILDAAAEGSAHTA